MTTKMDRSARRGLSLTSASLLGAIVVGSCSPPPSRVCSYLGRPLTDEELQVAALTVSMETDPTRAYVGLPSTPDQPDLGKFIQENPSCCIVGFEEGSEFMPAPRRAVAQGKVVNFVSLQSVQNPGNFHYLQMDACGQVYRRS